MNDRYAVGLADVRAAAARIAPHAVATPVLHSRSLDALAGRTLVWKCESFQRVGAFKFRGAMNAVLALDEARRARGVVTHSSGNHGQALALAAELVGIPAYIVMPKNAPRVKVEAVEAFGGKIVFCEPTQAAREASARAVEEKTGAAFIPPFDHADVIAGQGTIALELFQAHPDLDAVIVPIGGGGLVSGIALAYRELAPSVAVVGAEPSAMDDALRSKETGVRQPQPSGTTIADGLRTSLGELTFPVVRDVVSRIVTVEEQEIVEAMKLVMTRLKVVIEPSAGVPAAVALRARELPAAWKKVGVVLCGGNVDPKTLADLWGAPISN